jgi:hypothetical protein
MIAEDGSKGGEAEAEVDLGKVVGARTDGRWVGGDSADGFIERFAGGGQRGALRRWATAEPGWW